MVKTNLETKKDNAVVKKCSVEEARAPFKTWGSPRSVLEKLSELLPKIRGGNWNRTEEDNKILEQAIALENLDNHRFLSESMSSREWVLFAIHFANELTKEYDCKTPTEKALVHMIADSYMRSMVLSRKLNGNHSAEIINNVRTSYLAVTGKQLDQANRHFLAAIQTLKQFKSLPINVKVTAKNAFVAQNQQINTNQPHETDTK